MKLVSYKTEDIEHLGVFVNGHIYNLNSCNKLIPDNMSEFLIGGEPLMERAKQINQDIIRTEKILKVESKINSKLDINYLNTFLDAIKNNKNELLFLINETLIIQILIRFFYLIFF